MKGENEAWREKGVHSLSSARSQSKLVVLGSFPDVQNPWLLHPRRPRRPTLGLQPLPLLNSCPYDRVLEDGTSVSDQGSLSASEGDRCGKEATALRVRSGVLHTCSFFCHFSTTQWGGSNCPHFTDEQSEAQRSEEACPGHTKPGRGPAKHVLFPSLLKAIWS